MEKKNFKCPICGNDEHYRVPVVTRCDEIAPRHQSDPADLSKVSHSSLLCFGSSLREQYLYGDVVLESLCSAYACSNCGFVSLFATEFIKETKEKRASLEQQKENLERTLSVLKAEIESLGQRKEDLSSRISFVNEQLSSDEITIRQQRELQVELASLKQSLDGLQSADSLQNKINEIEDNLKGIKYKLEYLV